MKKVWWILVAVFLISVTAFVIWGFQTVSIEGDSENEYCFGAMTENIQTELYDQLDCENFECLPGATCTTKCSYGDVRTGIFSDRRHLELKEGEGCGIAIAIKNIMNETKTFSYNFSLDDQYMGDHCGEEFAKKAGELELGNGGPIQISPGDIIYEISEIKTPEGEFSCTVRYRLFVWTEDGVYDTEVLDVTIR